MRRFLFAIYASVPLWEIIAIAAGAVIVCVSATCAVVLSCRKKKKAAKLKTLKAKEVIFDAPLTARINPTVRILEEAGFGWVK